MLNAFELEIPVLCGGISLTDLFPYFLPRILGNRLISCLVVKPASLWSCKAMTYFLSKLRFKGIARMKFDLKDISFYLSEVNFPLIIH